MDLNDLPVIGSDAMVEAYSLGQELDEVFPGQDSHDFIYACEYNGLGPLDGHKVAGLLMTQQGEKDESNWVWLVKLDDGTHHWAVGGCDYTGWDCQSWLDWTTFEAA